MSILVFAVLVVVVILLVFSPPRTQAVGVGIVQGIVAGTVVISIVAAIVCEYAPVNELVLAFMPLLDWARHQFPNFDIVAVIVGSEYATFALVVAATGLPIWFALGKVRRYFAGIETARDPTSESKPHEKLELVARGAAPAVELKTTLMLAAGMSLLPLVVLCSAASSWRPSAARADEPIRRLVEAGEEEEAEKHLAAILHDDPHRKSELAEQFDAEAKKNAVARAWHRAASYYWLAGHCGRADAFERSADSHAILGNYYRRVGDDQRAAVFDRKALTGYWNASIAYFDAGQVQDAEICKKRRNCLAKILAVKLQKAG